MSSRFGTITVGVVTTLVLGGLLTTAAADLRVYATATDEAQWRARPEAYERIETRADRGGGVTFLERHHPLVTIKNDDIQAVVIRERRTAMNDAEQLEELRHGRGGTGPPYLEVTFRLKDRAAARLNAVLNARQGQTLGLRFDGRFITLVIVRGIFDTNEVSTFVEDLDRPSLESVLAPLKGKI